MNSCWRVIILHFGQRVGIRDFCEVAVFDEICPRVWARFRVLGKVVVFEGGYPMVWARLWAICRIGVIGGDTELWAEESGTRRYPMVWARLWAFGRIGEIGGGTELWARESGTLAFGLRRFWAM